MIFSAFFTLALQAQPAARPQGSIFTAMIPFILVFVIFYFLLIKPQRTKQKKHQEMVGQLKSGDKVITSGGIHGTVMGVQKDKIEVKIASNVKIDVSKNSIAVILTPKQKES
ncbi:MAG: preprotein translocase subunit YajC [Candidatus Aminicenantes bacterium]|nr:MAG: preprotein translocase subunit YajC [Candidatus Aminicenantes bacterium]